MFDELGISDLEVDAHIWRWHPPYEVARQSLIAAVQHLNLARTAIEAREVYPTSHFTVLRGALVGAAQGVWLLAPDDAQERQQPPSPCGARHVAE
ncbi:MAG TPA: hypothetical protein VJ976_01045 [Ornithinimicrobium sp.]|uniref:hypothetical protein n=1 Tax=Ornithinimicrobium sp. TaxID=1977084 RepID=UPI002B4758BF|nr:hypothetical protein [Ornithinimicrobium sp.]HKJ10953.1 hypothetical protein [Ornithinimicrobium sp.]